MVGFVLESEKLCLRPLEATDAERLFTLINDFDIVKNLSVVPWPYERHMADAFIADSIECEPLGEEYRRAIILRGSGDVIGLIDLRLIDGARGSFGYWLAKAHWGKGYMSEALGLLVAHAFGVLGLEALAAGALIKNHASLGVMRANGFVATDRYTLDRPALGDVKEMQRMRLTRAEWEASKP
ncbi:MAG: GNAT family N-acetyltransferase [Alphaproteobacteria bacterium]|nr:GNAT family N-acetyltransferase [Alphaproteobacteria bacterium]